MLPETSRRLVETITDLMVRKRVATTSRIYFVDDGSSDGTWSIIEQAVASGMPVSGIRLSRNVGHQSALLAGLQSVKGDVAISLDADLQDDLIAIEQMLDKFDQGADIVYGVRNDRSTDSVFKRGSAKAFYNLMRLLGIETVSNHADYRLMSRRALNALSQYREVNLFLRGLIPLLGFKTDTVVYARSRRFAGESKYPVRKMVALAINAVTSFSIVPLRLVTVVGILVFIGSLAVSFWILFVRFFTEKTIPGWASVVLPMYFLGGIQIFSIGIVGEYLGKIYTETKARPRFHVEKLIENETIKPTK